MRKIVEKESLGFSLIKLLVAIAIIGLLAIISLVFLSPFCGKRPHGRDARIKADMGQIRSLAETQFSEDGDYDDVSCASGDFVSLCNDINALTIGAQADVEIHKPASPAKEYCAKVQLNSGKWFCVDSTSVSKEYPAAAPPSCVGGTTPHYTCD